MKYVLVILSLCLGAHFFKVSGLEVFTGNNVDESTVLQQPEPFYFVTPVPQAKKLLDNIDLSFFKNRLAVSTYRYRIQTPVGGATSIDRKLVIWSEWTKDDLTEIKIPLLDLEGGYKLIVEYNPVGGNETRRYEVPFYVYYSGSFPTVADLKSEERDNLKQPEKEVAAAQETNVQKKTVAAAQLPPNDLRKEKKVTVPPTATASDDLSPRQTEIIDVSTPADTVSLLTEEKYETEIKELNIPEYPGGVFAKLSPSEDLNNHLVINAIDSKGNNQLHLAVISGKNDEVRKLISKGVDLNKKNDLGLAPLHIAVMKNNESIVRELIYSGADLNLAGNTGYTPLHIAAELNYHTIATELLSHGAEPKIKTDQGFNSITISKIQRNKDITRLLTTKNAAFTTSSRVVVGRPVSQTSQVLANPDIEFNLPFDQALVKRRNVNKTLRLIAIPVFAWSSFDFVSYKSKANHNLSLSRVAQTEEKAKIFYDNGVKYNKSAQVAGAVSLVSAYVIIHSSIRQKNVTTKMAKVF